MSHFFCVTLLNIKTETMSLTLHAHNDIEDAAKYFKIPLAMYRSDDVYIMQEDRCVFIGGTKSARKFLDLNEGEYCKSVFPLAF